MYIIPKPQEITENKGSFTLPYTGQIIMNKSCSNQVYEYAKLLKQYIAEDTGFHYEIRRNGSIGPIFLNIDEKLLKSQYLLEIKTSQITISAGEAQGILYGIQTLHQILRQKGAVLSCMTINDYPILENRGYYYDAGRGRVPTLDWLKSLVDTLCFYKMNQLQIYVEHSFLFSGFSEIWRDDTPLTAEEIMELDEYCVKRGIELIPSLACFGHLYKMLCTKSYTHLCELEHADELPFSFKDRMHHHTIDASNDESFLLVKKMILEFMPLFRSRKFNLCADETFDLGKGKNKDRAEKEGTIYLYMEYLEKLYQLVQEEGHIPMFWGDIILNHPEMVKKLPKEMICLNWNYDRNVTDESVKVFQAAGANQYVCPGVAGWNQWINFQQPSYQNITKMCEYGKKYGANGMLNTDWGDYGHINHPLFGIPGLIYGACASWCSEVLPYEELNQQISIVEYRDSSGQIMRITGELSMQESFSWMVAVQFKELHDINAGQDECETMIRNVEDNIITLNEKNSNIKRFESELMECISHMDSSTKMRVKPYLIAAEGMKLFNRLGEMLLLSFTKQGLKEEAWKLAKELETWYYKYRMLWYTVSKESELYRISEVMFWYADYLRKLD